MLKIAEEKLLRRKFSCFQQRSTPRAALWRPTHVVSVLGSMRTDALVQIFLSSTHCCGEDRRTPILWNGQNVYMVGVGKGSVVIEVIWYSGGPWLP